jgi:hypothetical protein
LNSTAVLEGSHATRSVANDLFMFMADYVVTLSAMRYTP